MQKVKLSTLSKDAIIYVEDEERIRTVEEVLKDLEDYKSKELYTTKKHYASFNAKEIIEEAVEEVYCNGMYEDWNDNILGDVVKEDIKEIQIVLNRILARNPEQNIAYQTDKLIEIDV
ncbi:hypothetical protein [Clostridium botulinum]|uniref:hypothetical protein n=1 Tax=Clostridium botulinum TaxID=1491 RepID=UPI001E437B91|nr:hypothetical protein [Clostridium botulinum]MCD3252351.1 hypothetical protein [Clostridium botulinum C/D]MCD3277471.1 hypothetical protein [Clostridium botulinum C/D]MCD3277985.1 hypothetical protein [Clostridium botulinum C/D]MCD3281500.1 hypothetical protein [Clostridium botulinum C/D]MCD3289240.1 hypothetical protein [Clostridium botulinum C/D]